MAYTPNFNDPRVIARSKQAIGFACGVMSTTKPHAWSSRYIDKYFGISSNKLSRYLRDKLLICTDDYYRYNSTSNQCKQYKLNQTGLDYLREQLKLTHIQTYPSVLQVAKSDHTDELATGNFE